MSWAKIGTRSGKIIFQDMLHKEDLGIWSVNFTFKEIEEVEIILLVQQQEVATLSFGVTGFLPGIIDLEKTIELIDFSSVGINEKKISPRDDIMLDPGEIFTITVPVMTVYSTRIGDRKSVV